MIVLFDDKEISKVILKAIQKNSHFSLHIITKYSLPEKATKDVYNVYDGSKLDQFTNDLESGELVHFKKIAIYGMI